MKAFSKKPATYDDLRKLPETMIGELVGGELIASPRPAIPHSNVAAALTGEILGPFQRGRGGPGGWWFLYEPEVHIGHNVLVPDLAGWRRDRLPRLPAAPFMELAPDWLCEILSPSTAGFDRIRKMPIYLREGVSHIWLIDPTARTLEAFRREGEKWVLVDSFGGSQRARIEPFDVHEIDLQDFWLEEEPS
jgi:Uma2 family endonuclease